MINSFYDFLIYQIYVYTKGNIENNKFVILIQNFVIIKKNHINGLEESTKYLDKKTETRFLEKKNKWFNIVKKFFEYEKQINIILNNFE